MLSYSKDELCAMTIHDLNPDFQADMWPGFWAETQRRGTMVFETAHRAKNGRLLPIEVSVNYLSYEGKEYHCAFVRDITERKRAEAALRQREMQLESLSAQLLQAQEEERRRIARELHDDFSQRLAALAIDLRTVQLEPSDSKPWGVSRLQQLGNLAEQLATELQQISHRLHPSILEHVGLEAAVKEHVDEFSARTGLPIEVMVLAVPKDVPLEQALCLYRVLQESLQNVRKHALATTVLVRLFRTGRGLGLCVHDDGQGFANAQGGEGRRGLGFTSMEERVKRHHGTFRIRTKPGEGTEVHAWIPLDERKSDG